MKKALQEQIAGLVDAWNHGYEDEAKRSTAAFFILLFLSFGACMLLPDLRELLMGHVMSLLEGKDVLNDSDLLSAKAIFSNNLQACVFSMCYGLIPFIYFSALALGLNSILLGVLAAYTTANGISPLLFLLMILPHGIFELPALILSFSMGLYVCGQITRRCRHDETALSVWDCLLQMSRLLLFVLMPLLLLAALVEAYITPWLLSLFILMNFEI